MDDARLRREALAATSSTGLEISRSLIAAKIRGQQANLPDLGRGTGELTTALELALRAETLDDVRAAESTAALAYWSAWSGLRVQFHRRDDPRVPVHWRRFDRRGSEVTGNPRLASDPAANPPPAHRVSAARARTCDRTFGRLLRSGTRRQADSTPEALGGVPTRRAQRRRLNAPKAGRVVQRVVRCAGSFRRG